MRKDPRREEQKKLIRKLRKCEKYLTWKKCVLRRDGWSEKDKGIQVHHHPKDISRLLDEYKILTVEQALKCSDLWSLDIGISLTRGEHYIITKLRRYKYLTEGFRKLIKSWFEDCCRRPKKVSEWSKGKY